jgi:LemA protein
VTTIEATSAAAAAVIVFWIVGAYNRMVRLRTALVERFALVDEQYRQRHVLLEEQVDMMAGGMAAAAAPRLDALRAACRQADAARDHAQARPGAASAVTSLRVAEEILADARARLPVQAIAGADLPALNSRLAAVDTALAFARREFNEAVAVYNAAIAQFPTLLVARLFSFRAAAAF